MKLDDLKWEPWIEETRFISALLDDCTVLFLDPDGEYSFYRFSHSIANKMASLTKLDPGGLIDQWVGLDPAAAQCVLYHLTGGSDEAG